MHRSHGRNLVPSSAVSNSEWTNEEREVVQQLYEKGRAEGLTPVIIGQIAQKELADRGHLRDLQKITKLVYRLSDNERRRSIYVHTSNKSSQQQQQLQTLHCRIGRLLGFHWMPLSVAAEQLVEMYLVAYPPGVPVSSETDTARIQRVLDAYPELCVLRETPVDVVAFLSILREEARNKDRNMKEFAANLL
eukprot:PhM_4_TR6934/c0_g1_i1/m.23860